MVALPMVGDTNSGYAVRAEYRPLPNCPTLRFGQLRIAANVVQNSPGALLKNTFPFLDYPLRLFTLEKNTLVILC